MPACKWLVIGSNGSWCRSHDVQDDLELPSGLDKVSTVTGFARFFRVAPLTFPPRLTSQQRKVPSDLLNPLPLTTC